MIAPDERAAVRKHAEAGNSLWPAEALRLLDALDTAEAEVARLRATVSPAWDEDTVRADLVAASLPHEVAVMSDGYPSVCVRSPEDAADVALAVVRDHLPVTSESRAQVEAEALATWKAANATVVEAVALLGGTFGESLREALAVPKGADRG